MLIFEQPSSVCFVRKLECGMLNSVGDAPLHSKQRLRSGEENNFNGSIRVRDFCISNDYGYDNIRQSGCPPNPSQPLWGPNVSWGVRQEEGFHSACPRLRIARSATATKRGRSGHRDMIETVLYGVFRTRCLLVGPGTKMAFAAPPPLSFCLGLK